MTAEQLEASRLERMRLNGHGALSLEDSRTWMEETGLCLFLPKRQFSTSIVPTFVEAVMGERNSTPDPKQIAEAEQMLVRLENDGVAVRLNLLGVPGEQPDFVVAAWVLPYVYALRGDRDWRRSPQLTGSRQVSQLAVQAYKLLEAGEATVPELRHTLGREVTDAAVLRAITELWQQLRIIPMVSAPGQPARWQPLRQRFQKAIAEGASTSQVTAISVLASIYLQAVIAASMEDVEIFLSPLTARSKVREVIRGLVATRQLHTISMGHSPHFYVAGTLPEFSAPPALFTSASIAAYYPHAQQHDYEDEPHIPASPAPRAPHRAEHTTHERATHEPATHERHATPEAAAPAHKPASASKPSTARPRLSRPATHTRDRKPTASASSRPARRAGQESRSSSARPASARPAGARPASARPAGKVRPAGGTRWSSTSSNGAHGKPHSTGNSATSSARGTASSGGSARTAGKPAPSGSRSRTAGPSGWSQRSGQSSTGHASSGKTAGKSSTAAHKSSHSRTGSPVRKETRTDARGHKPVLTATAKAGNGKRFGLTAPADKQKTKKRG